MKNEKVIVTFKSIPEMFKKEKDDIKPNTLRKIDTKDFRFKALRLGIVTHIKIINTESKLYFTREITDYTEWDNMAIISWKPKKSI